MCASGPDGVLDGLAFVAAKIVHNDGVARAQGRRQLGGDIELEDLAIHRTVEDQGRDDAVMAQAGNKGGGPPMAMRGAPDQAFATATASMAAVHIGLGPGLVNEDQALGIKTMLIGLPPRACLGDVRSVLFVGQHGFF